MSSTVNVGELFANAADEGTLSPASQSVLDVPDLGALIQAGLGVSVDDVTASEVTLVTLMIDDSGSIRFAGNAQAVRDGHNQILDDLAASKQEGSILVCCRYLNGRVLYPYGPISQAIRMTPVNYDPNLGTPLYDQSVVLLGTVLAKAQEFSDANVPVKTVTYTLTDGSDQHSCRNTAADVASLVNDLLMQETHIIGAVGFQDGYTDFHQVFGEMGIRNEWILTPDNTSSEVRRAFGTVSKSAVRASQSGATFSQTAVAGFGN
jgi:hypothetical protein